MLYNTHESFHKNTRVRGKNTKEEVDGRRKMNVVCLTITIVHYFIGNVLRVWVLRFVIIFAMGTECTHDDVPPKDPQVNEPDEVWRCASDDKTDCRSFTRQIAIDYQPKSIGVSRPHYPQWGFLMRSRRRVSVDNVDEVASRRMVGAIIARGCVC